MNAIVYGWLMLRMLPSTCIQAVHVMCPWALKQSRSQAVTKSKYDREAKGGRASLRTSCQGECSAVDWLGVLCRQDEQAEESERSASCLYTGARESCATGKGVRGVRGSTRESDKVRRSQRNHRGVEEVQRSQGKYRGVIGSEEAW